jgi:predicted negative regulator of RcsB-dependent stress response
MFLQKVCKWKAAILFLPFLTLGRAAAYAQHEHEHPVPEKLGTVQFPTSCSGKEQKNFERAVALLHSFAYSAAEKAFADVAKADPNCAMVHWGIAMTYFHPLWPPQLAPEDVARGRAEIERAAQLGGSEREREFIEALKLIYVNADSVPYRERAARYTSAMAKLAEYNPNDVECQVFYALALIATASPTDKTHANEKKAADLLEPLFRKYPQHPGIPHYLIHACDNAEMASRGVKAARVYAQIAPSAPHALHMPSHIYTRLGMWQDSIASNTAARKAARQENDIGEELHAMDYLTYANLQLGREQDAALVLDDLRKMTALSPRYFKVAYAASAMPARYAIERRQWDEATRLAPIADALPQAFAITAWSRAIGFARSKQAAAARDEAAKLKSAYEQLRAAGDDYWATQIHVQLNSALAWISYAEGKTDEAVKLMRDTADEEDAVEKLPVTPGAIVPAREQLGDLLLESNRPAEALKEFERTLALTPQRRGALAGLSRSKKLAETSAQ